MSERFRDRCGDRAHPVRSPRRIGDATPRWLVEEQAEQEEAVAEAQRGERRGGSTRA